MDRYRGVFNWYGESHTLWTHSTSEAGARTNLFEQLAKKVGYSFAFVSSYFVPSVDSYKITIHNKKGGERNGID